MAEGIVRGPRRAHARKKGVANFEPGYFLRAIVKDVSCCDPDSESYDACNNDAGPEPVIENGIMTALLGGSRLNAVDPGPCCLSSEDCNDPLPFIDPLGRMLDPVKDVGQTYGSQPFVNANGQTGGGCAEGYEGTIDEVRETYISCHLSIYAPNDIFQKYFWYVITFTTLFFLIMGTGGYKLRAKMKRQILMQKAEKRRQRRAAQRAEESGTVSK